MSSNINDLDFGSEDEDDFNPAQHVASDEEKEVSRPQKSSKRPSPRAREEEDDEGEREDLGDGNEDEEDDDEDDEDDEDIAVS